jgi:epoxyqueuosine reductase
LKNQISKHQITQLIKAQSKELGFDFCGISKAEFLENEAPKLDQWLQSNLQGEMSYMERNFDKRLDPRLLVDGAKSVISLLFNYYNPTPILPAHSPIISTYAYGEDYHFVIKDKLYELLSYIKNKIGDISGRVFVDSAPVMDKVWAAKSGLGWIGKHTNLINKKQGSFFFIAEIILDVELEYDGPIQDFCGTCTRCIDACPTDAIIEPYVLDSKKCISYLTIELRNEIPEEFKGKFENRVYGCDICQDVCPWNRFSKKHSEPRFEPNEHFTSLSIDEWLNINEEVFQKVFGKSAVQRAGYKGYKRNLNFLKL